MQSAWKSVLDQEDDTDWALFGYEGGQAGYVTVERETKDAIAITEAAATATTLASETT